MNIHQKTNTMLLLACLAISLTVSSGCRSGGFTDSFTKPDLSKLKFWESENLMFGAKNTDTPPPPARHFDPAPINAEKESQTVDLDSEKLQRRFKNDIEQMRAEISAATKALETPIRKPYSSDLPTNDELATNTKSTFEAAAGNVRSKMDGFGGQAKTGLSAAQNNFQAAMRNTTDVTNNDFAAAKTSANDMTQGWKDKVELPGLATGKKTIGDSLASVNKSLNDANDKLAAQARSKVDSAFQQGIGAFGGSLKPINNAAADTKNQFSSIGATTASKANPELERVQAQMAEAKQQIEELKKQIAMTSQAKLAEPPAQPVAASNSFGPSNTSPGNYSFGSIPRAAIQPEQSAPVERVAQLQTPNHGSQFPANSVSSSAPANRLRSNQLLRPDTQQQVAPRQGSAPSYPSTSHGGFAPRSNDFGGNFSPTQNKNFAPKANTTAPGSQVDFQTTDSDSKVVTANNAISPNGGESASQIQNHISEVDIPESILKGSGSYAPGSVQPLQSDK